EGLPKRSDFTSRADFGVALEGHCGLAPRSVLHEDGDVFLFMPDDSAWSSDTYEKHACLLSALVAAGETKFGFVGNEKIAEPEGKCCPNRRSSEALRGPSPTSACHPSRSSAGLPAWQRPCLDGARLASLRL